MEIVKDINRWSLSPEHKLFFSIERQTLRLRKARKLCLSTLGRSRHRFSSLDFRLPLPGWCEKHFRGFRNDRVLATSLSNKFRCLEDSGDRLSGQKPYTGIDRNMKKFLFDGCRDIVEHICRIVFWEKSLSVVRRLSVRHALANPFSKSVALLKRVQNVISSEPRASREICF